LQERFATYGEQKLQFCKKSIGESTTRRILKGAGIQSPKKRRKAKHHRRRQRKAYAGELVQTDATPHDFFGTGAAVCLHGAIDDATGQI